MRKVWMSMGLLTSMYAIPPCEYDMEQVCMYLYKGPMSAEVNVINMTQKKVVVQAEAKLDKTYRKIDNLVLAPNQTMTLIKTRYDNSSTKPSYISRKFSFKYMN
ncbi:hypothetical protein [Sulfurospirillum halorespirans]|nr:hypothetical protein [Sulfurospirillum halorespirans]